MHPDDVLAGLDAHPWADVSHAYGPAEDLPDLLRALAEGGEDAEEAISELYSCILHQGTVYSASVDAVPYLARIAAAAGPGTAEVLRLLGGLAESDDEWEIAPGAVRAAVVTRIPLLIPLLTHQDADIRLLTAWTLGRTRDAETAPAALRTRWTAEPDPGIRAEILVALGRVDLPGAAAEARALLGATTPTPLRLAALLVALDAAEPWTDAHHEAALGLLPARELTVGRYGMHHRDPLHAIVDNLLHRGTDADRESAFALLDAALRDGRPEVRTEALAAADHACHLSRGAPDGSSRPSPRSRPPSRPQACSASSARPPPKPRPSSPNSPPRPTRRQPTRPWPYSSGSHHDRPPRCWPRTSTGAPARSMPQATSRPPLSPSTRPCSPPSAPGWPRTGSATTRPPTWSTCCASGARRPPPPCLSCTPCCPVSCTRPRPSAPRPRPRRRPSVSRCSVTGPRSTGSSATGPRSTGPSATGPAPCCATLAGR
ncbi:HEAT repeat domain-containing protein [Kitasatospora paranensis]|uniref:HEAT repeat domain-containing protein n=1 Tax=Kitasatospora paranensis TaxID=258053 RepID=UPI0031E83805